MVTFIIKMIDNLIELIKAVSTIPAGLKCETRSTFSHCSCLSRSVALLQYLKLQVCNVAKDVCHVCGGSSGCKFLPLYTSTLLLDRVSQNKIYFYGKSFSLIIRNEIFSFDSFLFLINSFSIWMILSFSHLLFLLL